MNEVLSRAQIYIQLEEDMKSFVNQSLKHDNDREKMNLQCESPTHVSDQNQGQPTCKKQAFPVLSSNPLRAFRMEQHFIPSRLPINEVFNAIKDQPWVRRPKPIQHDPTLSEVEDYCSYHDSKGYKTTHFRSL